MGVSTNAMLYYGFDFYDPESGLGELPFWSDEEDDISCIDYKYTEKLSDFEKARIEELGVKISEHCSCDFPIYYVCIQEYLAHRSYPKKIAELKTEAEWDEKIKEACGILGIPYREPAWNLASYWG